MKNQYAILFCHTGHLRLVKAMEEIDYAEVYYILTFKYNSVQQYWELKMTANDGIKVKDNTVMGFGVCEIRIGKRSQKGMLKIGLRSIFGKEKIFWIDDLENPRLEKYEELIQYFQLLQHYENHQSVEKILSLTAEIERLKLTIAYRNAFN